LTDSAAPDWVGVIVGGEGLSWFNLTSIAAAVLPVGALDLQLVSCPSSICALLLHVSLLALFCSFSLLRFCYCPCVFVCYWLDTNFLFLADAFSMHIYMVEEK
jgi:hypothetical protein